MGEILKRKLFGIVSLIIPFAFLILSPMVLADEPTEPSEIEKQNFKAKLDRIENHSSQLPKGGEVNDVIKSLTSTVTKTIDCPKDATLREVTVNITTKHIKWDPKLTIEGKKVPLPANRIGHYIWNTPYEIKGKEKTVTATNYIMLDPKVSDPQEKNPPFGPMADEGLLYHEFLHGQLLINAMSTDKTWKKKVCNCNFDLGPMDKDHKQITDFVNTYLQNLAGLDTKVHTVRPSAQKAKDATGRFEVIIAEESILGDKKEWSAEPYFPDGSNVEVTGKNGLNIVIKDGKIIAKGKLIDPSKPGFFLVHIDPPTKAIFIAIETGVVILPVKAVPLISSLGILILVLLILTVSLFGLAGKKKLALK